MEIHLCPGCRERDARIAELQARLAELERFQRETAYLRDEARAERDLRPLTGESPAMKAVRRAIQQVAQTDSTVLILGETGTGKELVARAIHQLSPRRERLLVAVNCAALAPGVVASELFGHEQGALFIPLNAERVAVLKGIGGNITEKQEPKEGPGCRGRG
ncbi:MAG TPA: sigma 54-interacting transcriptional regulator [Gemmataceae bacterium]|jgi:transcriptional regulator with GAF, ATPase, and Fis domain|nr:sigma 54-interacting transcriptional regulator [Gemmataceae bacterium]